MVAHYDLATPDTLEEALGIMADNNGSATCPLAGGTNLIVDIRSKRENPDLVVGLGKLDELRGLVNDGDRIEIGARTTVTDLLNSSDIFASAPSLVDSAKAFAGQMVRNTATVGGNIACGSPAADLVPPLMSLDAEVTLVNKSGSRTIALDDYYLGYKQDARQPDELITKISWDRLPKNSVNSFYKLARRKGDAITITGLAISLTVANGVCERARIALGAVAPVVMRAKKAEALLNNQKLTPALINAAAKQAVEDSSPIDDVRASAEYRVHTIEVLTRRLISNAWQALS